MSKDQPGSGAKFSGQLLLRRDPGRSFEEQVIFRPDAGIFEYRFQTGLAALVVRMIGALSCLAALLAWKLGIHDDAAAGHTLRWLFVAIAAAFGLLLLSVSTEMHLSIKGRRVTRIRRFWPLGNRLTLRKSWPFRAFDHVSLKVLRGQARWYTFHLCTLALVPRSGAREIVLAVLKSDGPHAPPQLLAHAERIARLIGVTAKVDVDDGAGGEDGRMSRWQAALSGFAVSPRFDSVEREFIARVGREIKPFGFHATANGFVKQAEGVRYEERYIVSMANAPGRKFTGRVHVCLRWPEFPPAPQDMMRDPEYSQSHLAGSAWEFAHGIRADFPVADPPEQEVVAGMAASIREVSAQVFAAQDGLKLRAAAACGFTSIVKDLLRSGISPHKGGLSGYTPIIDAATYLRLECVRVLLQAGADPFEKHHTMTAEWAVRTLGLVYEYSDDLTQEAEQVRDLIASYAGRRKQHP